MREHRTELDGWQAVWLLARHRIRIMLVHSLFVCEPLKSAAYPAAAPDLVHMREQFLMQSWLWAAVRNA